MAFTGSKLLGVVGLLAWRGAPAPAGQVDECDGLEFCKEDDSVAMLQVLTEVEHHQGQRRQQRQPSDMSLLRIPKTGTSTFDELVCRRFAQELHKDYRCSEQFDWNAVQDSKAIAVLLRNPVERTVSEFFDLSNRTKFLSSWQAFDVPEAAKSALWSSLEAKDLLEYLFLPKNPALNRQTLYLAGFKPGRSLQLSGGRTVSLDDGVDWRRDGEEILQRAKEHLASGHVTFGFTEDYDCAMRLFANAFHWDAATAMTRARESPRDVQTGKADLVASLLQGKAPDLAPLGAASSTGLAGGRWAPHLPPDVALAVREANAVDVALYAYAQQLLEPRRRAAGCGGAGAVDL